MSDNQNENTPASAPAKPAYKYPGFNVRLPTAVKKPLEAAAKEDDRSVSKMAGMLIQEALKRRR